MVSNIVWHILNTKKQISHLPEIESSHLTPEGGVCTKETKKTF